MKSNQFILVLTFVSTFCFAQSRDASFSPDGSKIVFVSSVKGINQVFIMNIDGSKKTQITNSKNTNYYPIFSPDGKRIVFMTFLNETSPICIINIDGSNFKCITEEKDKTADPNWFPYENRIVFSSNRDGNHEIYSMKPDGIHWKNLTNHTSSDQTPSVSPDGKYIVFVSNRDGNSELYLMSTSGNNIRRLTHDPRSDRVPRWSSDSKKIIWYSREYSKVVGSGKKSWETAEIYIMNIDGSERKKLTHNLFRDQSPSISPDGKHIVFTSKRTGKNQIFIKNLETHKTVQLTFK